MDTNAFVHDLYQKIIVAVKASNSIPSEEDEYHYYLKHNTSFASATASCKSSIHRLAVNLASTTSHEPNEEEDSDSTELFQHSDPKEWITDCTDHLLDEAFRLLQGEAPRNEKKTSNVQMENCSAEFAKSSTNLKSQKKFQKMEMPKPQQLFQESIDNSTAPFVSKLSSKPHAVATSFPIHEEDASFHPYYNELVGLKIPDWQLRMSEMDHLFDKISLQKALFLWVDSADTFQQMLLILQEAHALAIDLEHHNYRSYLGLTCLMQISTHNHDFLVDTLALRSSLQLLNQVFCDPQKLKVLHGADMDILWLQRDLGLYVVNMFDTGRAARVLQLPRFSLAYLLKKYCDIEADKQYQLADWRQRPLTQEMTRYAREDTRYLLFIYRKMKEELLLKSDSDAANLIREVHKHSNQLCLQVYSKPQVSEDDCTALVTKLTASAGVTAFSELQQRVFRRLYFWRDAVARETDESPMYVLPNQLLLQIARHLPSKSEQLLRLRNVIPPLVQKHALEIVQIILNEKKMEQSEETKAVPTISPAAQTSSKSAAESFVEDDVSITAYKPWKSVKRKITIVEDEKWLHKRLCFPLIDHTDNRSEILQQVWDSVRSIVFTVKHCDENSTQPEAPIKSSNSVIKADESAPESFPQSISDMYKLPRKHSKTLKKQPMKKNSAKNKASTTPIDAASLNTDATVHEQAPYKPFDYTAAKSKLGTDPFTAQVQNAPQSKVASKKALIASGYNPFVNAQSSKTPKVPNRQLKHFPLKKLSQAPRNATFQ